MLLATPKKDNPEPSAVQIAQIRAGKRPVNMPLEVFESYQVRFDEAYQPASSRRGSVTNAELYVHEKRLAEEFMMRYLPELLADRLMIATGRATEFLINHKTGEVVEVPVNPKTRVLAQDGVLDRLFGKPETIKTVNETVEKRETLTILIGPAADAYNDEQERARVARMVEAPQEPLVLPSPPVADLLALPPAFEDREVRKTMLDEVLKGKDPVAVRAVVHDKFGPRDARRAARKEARAGESE